MKISKNIPLLAVGFCLTLLVGACYPAVQDPVPAECSCPAPELPAAAPSPFAPGARLTPNVWTSDDGSRAPTGTMFDRERGETCSFVRVKDAGAFCLPAFIWHSKPGWYADAACTQEVAIVDACDELPRYVRDETAQPWQTCEPRPLEALIPLGKPLPVGAPLYSLSTGSCSAQSVTDEANHAMPLGEPIPLSEFVSAELVPFEPAP
jgi:hypothetical protein